MRLASSAALSYSAIGMLENRIESTEVAALSAIDRKTESTLTLLLA